MRVQGLVLAAFAGVAIACGCAQKRSAPEAGGPAPGGGAAAAGAVVGGDCRARAEGARLVPIGEPRQGSTVALATVEGRAVVLVADEDARAIVTFDAEQHALLATTPLGGAPSQLLVAKDGRVLVALRDQAKLVALERGAEALGPLVARCAVQVAAEPVALAVTPDDATVLVSSGWGHTLAGLEAATLARRFAVDLPREPRAVTVSGDGKRAFVAHAVGGQMSVVDLGEGSHGVTELALQPRLGPTPKETAGPNPLTSCQGYALARLASPGSRLLAPMVAVQPGNQEQRTAGYGDVSTATEQSAIAVVDEGTIEASEVSLVMRPPDFAPPCLLPRAAAVDDASRTLLVACLGVDEVVAYDALALSPAAQPLRHYPVGGGPSGIAVDPRTGRAFVWAQYERRLSVLDVRDADPIAELGNDGKPRVASVSLPTVYASADAHRWAIGRQLFHAVGDARVSGDGRACASCHPDGRDDALTWATPDGPRRTAMLAGRLKDSAPYGWTGASHDVREHVGHTFERLRGAGVTGLELDALLAYLESLEPPRGDVDRGDGVARGDAIFHSADAGCARCHRDGSAFTDGERHNVASRAQADRASAFDTPSLRFVGARAPYFHDGRYGTLAELLKATSSTMGNTERLSSGDLEDLEAYLRTL